MKAFVIVIIGTLSLIPLSKRNHLSRHRPFSFGHDTKAVAADSLPDVLPKNHGDLVESRLRDEALRRFAEQTLAETTSAWEKQRKLIRDQIIQKSGIIIDHALPLNYQETGVTKMEGFSVRNIIFQTRSGVYTTANLFIPNGKGPFPAVIHMHGHWPTGRVHEVPQSLGPSLALNGYVCLNVDAFGSGERTTTHGLDEYHGANLGASLMNVGESLLGFQVSDNIRGVDLLASLPYVDKNKIGATGASGGGNQTMWLTAVDERIKASMPVVSVGTFESAVMRSNCVCELLIDGLTFTETAGVLGLIAPRALKMCNHEQDSNPTFYPLEMKRSYENAKPIFKMLGAENNIDYQLFNLEHGYWPEDREAMLGWFDLHLKGIGSGQPKKEIPFKTLPAEQLMVYKKGHRDPRVASIAEYCRRKGGELRAEFLSTKTFNTNQKKKELTDIIRTDETIRLKEVHPYPKSGGWDKFMLECPDGKLIPLLYRAPADRSHEYVILCDPDGKKSISPGLLEEIKLKGTGIVLVDLSGTGESRSASSADDDRLVALHTQSRAELWLGKTMLGEWVKELNMVTEFLIRDYQAERISIDGRKEAGLAALFLSATAGNIDHTILREAPISYLFDTREGIDYFSMAVHLPGFLQWGDISLAAALTGKSVTFINPVTMSGNRVDDKRIQALKTEFENVAIACGSSGKTDFINSK